MLKFGRSGEPHFRTFTLSKDCKRIFWVSGKKEKFVVLSAVSGKDKKRLSGLILGQRTTVFTQVNKNNMQSKQLSFSLMYDNCSRTLDLVCTTPEQYDVWTTTLRYLLCNHGDTAKLHKSMQEVEKNPRPQKSSPIRRSAASSKSSGGTATVMRGHSDLYVWGYGGFGQLGLGSSSIRDNIVYPTMARAMLGAYPSSENDLPVRVRPMRVSCGADHTLVLSRSGELWSWGNDSSGRLGLQSVSQHQIMPRKVKFTGTATDMACGDFHNLAIADNGSLYSWGSGVMSQVGHGESFADVRIPTLLKMPTKVTHVAAGHAHSAAVTEDGQMHTWGNGICGSLGHGSQDIVHEPKLVEALQGHTVTAIACGDFHTLAISGSTTEVWAWGANQHGQLGNGSRDDSNVPIAVKKLKGVYRIAAGAAHSVAAVLGEETSITNVFAWGLGDHGQLGLGKQKPEEGVIDTDDDGADSLFVVTLPTKVEGVAQALLSTDNALVGKGNASPDSKGRAAAASIDMPPDFVVDKLACGAHHTVLLVKVPSNAGIDALEGRLLAWGDGEFGQLGMGKLQNTFIPRQLDMKDSKGTPRAVNDVSCGGRFTCAVVNRVKKIEDDETAVCMDRTCNVAFTVWVRRHHCRACGGVFCDNCTLKRTPILYLNFVQPVRVCDACYEEIQG